MKELQMFFFTNSVRDFWFSPFLEPLNALKFDMDTGQKAHNFGSTYPWYLTQIPWAHSLYPNWLIFSVSGPCLIVHEACSWILPVRQSMGQAVETFLFNSPQGRPLELACFNVYEAGSWYLYTIHLTCLFNWLRGRQLKLAHSIVHEGGSWNLLLNSPWGRQR